MIGDRIFRSCRLMEALSVPLYDCRDQSVVEQCLPLRGLEIGHSAYYLLYILAVIVLLTRNKASWSVCNCWKGHAEI